MTTSPRNSWGGPPHHSPSFSFCTCDGMIEVWHSWQHYEPAAVCSDWDEVLDFIRKNLSHIAEKVGPLEVPPRDFDLARERRKALEAYIASYTSTPPASKIDLSDLDLSDL